MHRRDFLQRGLATATATTLASKLKAREQSSPRPRGKAEHCVLLWLGGGACQIDTWDPKRLGDASKKVAGSYYESIPTTLDGVRVCRHLERSADILDRTVLLRTVHHDVIDEHAAAVNRMHTGRPTSGTVVYPSIGSVVTHELGPADEGVPPYVVMGYPNLTRGPGFLGAKHGYLYLTETESGPPGLTRPKSVARKRQARRERLLAELSSKYGQRSGADERVRQYAEMEKHAFGLTRSDFMGAFELSKERSALRERYGSEFGQRCLLARRLIERGVRFIEVSHNLNFINGTGWDTHNEGQKNQHLLIEELDKAFSSLVRDLECRGLLEKTLIVISTEFGRPAKFDGRGGRGHQSRAFSVVLAGGGLRTGTVVGVTDDLGETVVEDPVSVPDLFATIYASMGIDPAKELYAGDRPVPITDEGKPLARLF